VAARAAKDASVMRLSIMIHPPGAGP